MFVKLMIYGRSIFHERFRKSCSLYFFQEEVKRPIFKKIVITAHQ